MYKSSGRKTKIKWIKWKDSTSVYRMRVKAEVKHNIK